MIPFPDFQDDKYLDEMSREELQAYLVRLQNRLAALDEKEPRNMNGEDYDIWADEHEALEDTIDEVLDFLDEVQ